MNDLILGVQRACRLVRDTLDMIEKNIQPGMRTEDVDKLCTKHLIDNGGKSGCKNYLGYPKNICVSINEVACHGIPGPRVIQKTDLVNVDIVVEIDGFYGDAARTFAMPECSAEAQELSRITREARDAAIQIIKPGITTGDIGHAVETYVKEASKNKLSIVKGYCGHGIGRKMHEPPKIPNHGIPGTGAVIEAGMFFTVEPIVCMGNPEVYELGDGWTVVTKDGSWSAQWEHTLMVTEDGCVVCT